MKRPARYTNQQCRLTFEIPIEIDLDEETKEAVVRTLASMLIEAMSETTKGAINEPQNQA